MTTQYTSILKLALPVQGELSGTWGDVVNDNITSMVEQAIAGRAVVNTWSGNSHTLTTANGTTAESRCAMLEFTDTGSSLSAAGTVVCPALSKIYIAKNASGENVTLKTSSGSGILVPNGRTMFLFCDGTNVVEAVTSTTSLQLGTSTTVTAVLDEDNMASNSATSLATQQSIKAYVDAQVGASDTLAEILANGNTTTTDQKIQFRDSAIYINSSADGQLDIVADTEIQIAATTVDLNGNLDVSGTVVAGGVVTANAGVVVDNIAIDGTTLTSTDDFIVDASSDINLDAGGGQVRLKGSGSTFVTFNVDATPEVLLTGGPSFIGTTTSDAALTIFGSDGGSNVNALVFDMAAAGAATFNAGVTFGGAGRFDNSASTPVRLHINNSGSNDYASIYADTASAYKDLVLNPSGGSVGIGIAPLSFTELVINTATDRNIGVFDNAAGATICGLTDAGASSALRLAGSPLLFTGNGGSGAEHMRIDSSGNLLVGTTSTSIATTSSETGTQISDGGISIAANNPVAQFNRISSDGAIVNLRKDGTTVGSIGTLSGTMYIGNGDCNLLLTGATDQMLPVGTNGATKSGQIDLGSAGNLFKDLYLSGTARVGGQTGTLKLGNDGTYHADIEWEYNNNELAFTTNNVGNFTFNSNGTERMRIASSGRVGIGTSSPVSSLHVSGNITIDSSSNAPYLDFVENGDTGDSKARIAMDQVSGTAGEMLFYTEGSGTLSQRMKIDSSGRVGIGTSSPAELVEIYGTEASGGVELLLTNVGDGGTSTTPYTAIRSRLNPTRNGGEIRFGRDSSYGDAASADSNIQFWTALNDTNVERLRIDSSGNVLVGKTAADFGVDGVTLQPSGVVGITRDGGVPLILNRKTSDGDIVNFQKSGTVVGSIGTNSGDLFFADASYGGIKPLGDAYAIVPSTNSGVDYDNAMSLGTSSVRFKNLYLSGGVYANNASGAFLWNASNAHIAFGTNDTERMRIASSGSVGIGTSSPAADLHVADASDSNAQIRINGSTSTVYSRLYSDNNGVLAISTDGGNQVANSYMMFEVKGSERMRIDSSGNVGIGCTPSAKLDVNGEIRISNTTADSHLYLYGGAGYKAKITLNEFGVRSWILGAGTNTSGTFTITDGAAERMRIDSAGKIQIGNNIPMWSGSFGGAVFLKGNNATADRNVRLAIVDSTGAQDGDKELILDNNGDVTVKGGDLIFGTAGKGIVLGATTNVAANTLDDYEEGTWTPVLRGSSTAGTPSVGTLYGSYVKIGKLVTLTLRVTNLTLSGGSGAIQITGIPFTATTAGSNYGSAAFSMTNNINFDGDKNQNWYMGSSYMLGLESQGGGGWADLAVTNASAIYIHQTITYEEA